MNKNVFSENSYQKFDFEKVIENRVHTEGVSLRMCNEKGDISIVWGAGMAF